MRIIIKDIDLKRKYKQELHANEIVLLAYYIATVNIENAYHDLIPKIEDNVKDPKYVPFEGIVLTDTFQLGETEESEELFSETFPQNSARATKQKKTPVRVIIGNPPYSIGQKSANDNAQNQSYPNLEKRIESTYAASSTAGLNKSLYDAYIKAFRWSTDRLKSDHGGIIAFVTNGSWIDGNSTDGFRKTIENEFSSIWVFNLRGNQRTSGELSRREGGKIFGSGSRAPIAITLLVKNPDATNKKAIIHYHDIGDYLSREEKLKIITGLGSGGNPKMSWKTIHPNEHGDWINHRNDAFDSFIPLAPEKKFDKWSKSFFNTYAIGVATNRDAWVYNFSKQEIENNMQAMINFYNEQTKRFKEISSESSEIIIDSNPEKISWTRSLRRDSSKGILHSYITKRVVNSLYRPFCKQQQYYHKPFIESPGLWSQLFPNPDVTNLVIGVSGVGQQKEFSPIITDIIADLQVIDKGQYFPLYYFEKNNNQQRSLFDEPHETEYIRRDGISDFILSRAQKQYGKNVSKEDIFFYVYGFLHSPDFRTAFANDLKKMLPRLPLVGDVRNFWKFSKSGRQLAELHVEYESVPSYPEVKVTGEDSGYFKVQKMRFPKKGQKDTIIFNSKITISNIPDKAYEYIVNGKSAIEWIMERYQVTIDKKSKIKNDPNDWAAEVGNPRYILDLLLSVINVSVQTVDIVNETPQTQLSWHETK